MQAVLAQNPAAAGNQPGKSDFDRSIDDVVVRSKRILADVQLIEKNPPSSNEDPRLERLGQQLQGYHKAHVQSLQFVNDALDQQWAKHPQNSPERKQLEAMKGTIREFNSSALAKANDSNAINDYLQELNAKESILISNVLVPLGKLNPQLSPPLNRLAEGSLHRTFLRVDEESNAAAKIASTASRQSGAQPTAKEQPAAQTAQQLAQEPQAMPLDGLVSRHAQFLAQSPPDFKKITDVERVVFAELQKQPYINQFIEPDAKERLRRMENGYSGANLEQKSHEVRASLENEENFLRTMNSGSAAGAILRQLANNKGPEVSQSVQDPKEAPSVKEESVTIGDLRLSQAQFKEIQENALIRARTWLVNDDRQINMGKGKKAGYSGDPKTGQLQPPHFDTDKDRDKFDKELTDKFKEQVRNRLHELEPSLRKNDVWWSKTRENVLENFYSLGTSADPNNRTRSLVLALSQLEVRAQLHAMGIAADMQNPNSNLANRQTFSGQTPQQYRFNMFFPGGAMMGGMGGMGRMGGFGGGFWSFQGAVPGGFWMPGLRF